MIRLDSVSKIYNSKKKVPTVALEGINLQFGSGAKSRLARCVINDASLLVIGLFSIYEYRAKPATE